MAGARASHAADRVTRCPEPSPAAHRQVPRLSRRSSMTYWRTPLHAGFHLGRIAALHGPVSPRGCRSLSAAGATGPGRGGPGRPSRRWGLPAEHALPVELLVGPRWRRIRRAVLGPHRLDPATGVLDHLRPYDHPARAEDEGDHRDAQHHHEECRLLPGVWE